MSDKEHVWADKFKTEWSKLRKMTWRERLGYFKDYYTVPLIIALVFVMVAVAFVQGFQNRGKEPFLNCAVLEYTGVRAAVEEIGKEYMESASANQPEGNASQTEQEAETSDAAFSVFDYTNVSVQGLETGHDYQNFQALSAQLAVGDVDIIFTTKGMIEFLQVNRDSYFVPLEELYTAEQLAVWDGYLLEIQDENGENYAVAVDVSGWPQLKESIGEEPLYAAVVIGGTHQERAAEFLIENSNTENGW